MRLKRFCDGCRAFILEPDSRGLRWAKCTLGYKTETKHLFGAAVDGLPQEPCPKPKTWSQWANTEPKASTKGEVSE